MRIGQRQWLDSPVLVLVADWRLPVRYRTGNSAYRSAIPYEACGDVGALLLATVVGVDRCYRITSTASVIRSTMGLLRTLVNASVWFGSPPSTWSQGTWSVRRRASRGPGLAITSASSMASPPKRQDTLSKTSRKTKTE
jgi:hypothetical protein